MVLGFLLNAFKTYEFFNTQLIAGGILTTREMNELEESTATLQRTLLSCLDV